MRYIYLFSLLLFVGCSASDKYCASYCDAKDYDGSYNGKKACYCSDKQD